MTDHPNPSLTRRALLAGLMSSVAGAALAGAPVTSLRPKPRPADLRASRPKIPTGPSFESILRDAGLSGDKSIAVVDLGTGRILEAEAPAQALPPASVTKAVTTLYGLNGLSPTHRFTTRILATGPIENGIVQGDLILVAGGDPHLDSDGFGNLADQLVGRGIKGVTGRFLINASALPYCRDIDAEQPVHVGYNPSLSGMILNFNRVYFEWKRGKDGFSLAMTARGERYRPTVDGIRMTMSGRETPTYTYQQIDGIERWSVRRSALGKGGSRWLPVRQPVDYAAEAFVRIAASKGIKLPRGVQSGASSGTLLAAEQSAQLRLILRSMLRFSTNITAEAVGMATSRKSHPDTKKIAQSGAVMSDWVKSAYGTGSSRFVDHSGLGDGSRVSARDMARILQSDGWHGQLRPLLKDIKLLDEKRKAAPIQGAKVAAKTGTLNFASALAGYIDCPNGRKLAFAIFTADLDKRAAIPKDQRERPPGGKSWARKSRAMQQKLLRRWINTYGIT
jgi:D-alanyl-D-alanine carboxypeptidase/D-alanyl-D-alanine-endopeptidase (penicillin-binding protein 4)